MLVFLSLIATFLLSVYVKCLMSNASNLHSVNVASADMNKFMRARASITYNPERKKNTYVQGGGCSEHGRYPWNLDTQGKLFGLLFQI
jgi:hypothetical protein